MSGADSGSTSNSAFWFVLAPDPSISRARQPVPKTYSVIAVGFMSVYDMHAP